MADAPNQVVTQVVSFAPDPRGWGMFARLVGRTRRDLQEQPPVIERTARFGGWVASPQRFIGLDGRLGGVQRAVTPRDRKLVNERDATIADPALSAFYDRMRRQRS